MLRPAPADYPATFQPYVAAVPDGDVLAHLQAQGQRTQALLATLDEQQGGHRYAEGKWTVKQVLQHVADTERVFAYRALCFARGDESPLPGMDENRYAEHDGCDGRPLAHVARDLAAVRAATLSLFRGLDAAAWARRGVANGNGVTVRALPWLVAGHELHHLAVLQQRYRVGGPA